MALPLRRPVILASYGQPVADPVPSEGAPAPASAPEPVAPKLRTNFPPPDTIFEGGYSDGYRFQSTFAAGRLANSYEMVRVFLGEQGYGDVPLPRNVEELRAFRLPRRLRHQLSLFGEDGYVHNPVKILFPPPGGRRGALLLEVYNEAAEDHLLRFHLRK